MGCCLSRSTGPNSPYPGGDAATSASARAINHPPNLSAAAAAPSGAGSGVASPTSPQQSPQQQGQSPDQQRRRHRQSQQPLSQHINKPLRRHRWVSRDRVWTRQALARERADFFDTRVTGRVEIWQTVRAALEILWESAPRPTPADIAAATSSQQRGSKAAAGVATGSSSSGGGGRHQERAAVSPIQPSQDQDEGLATAQSILSAAEVTLPSGDLAQGVYDALGNYYPLPEWIVADPLNTIDAADLPAATDEEEDDDDDDDELVSDAKRDVYIANSPGATEGGDGHDEDGMGRRHREKGKGVAASIEETITVRCRLSENARDVIVTIGKNESVKHLSRKIIDEARLPSTSRVRIAYLGRILREHPSLISQGWIEGHVVNALVFHAR